jgi:hypothetical protein
MTRNHQKVFMVLHNTLHSKWLLESVRLTNQKHAIYDQKLTPYGGGEFLVNRELATRRVFRWEK